MKDEEADRIAGTVWDSHCETEDGQLRENGLFSDMVKVGYRAAMEAVMGEMDRISSLPDEERTHGDDWKDLQDWLEGQVKKEGV